MDGTRATPSPRHSGTLVGRVRQDTISVLNTTPICPNGHLNRMIVLGSPGSLTDEDP